MYYCQKCKKLYKPQKIKNSRLKARAYKLVTKIRSKKYFYYETKNGKKIPIDKLSKEEAKKFKYKKVHTQGNEIVEEILVCQDCYVRSN